VFGAASALPSAVEADIIDKDLLHLLGSDGKEMRAAFPLRSVQSHQVEIGLIHQVGALHGVVGTFLAQLKAGQTLQFLGDQGRQSIQRLAVGAPPAPVTAARSLLPTRAPRNQPSEGKRFGKSES